MCGIVGLVRRSPGAPAVAPVWASRAIKAIAHRGPDARGEYTDDRVWLGHVRLSILDLSSSGNQPMLTADGRFVISYNGEVYNFRELATGLSLTDLGSTSDTAVVLEAVAKLGIQSFRQFNGIFAFAIYDRERKKIWLVRDRLGVKPLYYRSDPQTLVFASEIKGVLALTDKGSSECDETSLHEWLYYGNTLGGRTLHKGISQLLPGHYLELDLTTFTTRVEAYWSLQQTARISGAVKSSTSEMIAETKRLLDAAVHRQLVSDVPVGVFLSGGVDSTAITAIASRHQTSRLATFSAGFDDLNGVDERPKARKIAAYYGTTHHELHIRGTDLPDLVEKMVHHHDSPFSDAANIPLYLMAAQVSGTTKVVLQGDGGDELFGGYRRYVALTYLPWLRLLAHFGDRLPRVFAGSPYYHRARRYLNAFAEPGVATTMGRLLTTKNPHLSPTAVFVPRLRAIVDAADPFARYKEIQPLFADHDLGSQMSLVDLMVELPDIFLEKVDRSTMAVGLEVRVPFLDNELVDYVTRIPGRNKMPWGKKKWLLKEALRGIVPRDVLYGPKTGFRVPYGFWLRTALKPLFFDNLATLRRTRPNILDAAQVEALFAATDGAEHDRADTLWKLLNFMIWCNKSKVTFAT